MSIDFTYLECNRPELRLDGGAGWWSWMMEAGRVDGKEGGEAIIYSS